MSGLAGVRRSFLGISFEEATCVRRGFHVTDAPARHRLEQIGEAFLSGYMHAIDCADVYALSDRLATIPHELAGFAFEGAAMALALLDELTPWSPPRLRTYIGGPATAHVYMAHVGAGWILGRLPWRPRFSRWGLDPLLLWLVFDGYGFHEGFFHWPRSVQQQHVPARLKGYEQRAFDQGLGRSLWFVEGTDVDRIAQAVAAFPDHRRGDIWSGVGLACTYAGPATPTHMDTLRDAAGVYCLQVAQGAVFAAKARLRAGNPSPHTELACERLCLLPLSEAAALADTTLDGLSSADESSRPRYQVWRERIQAHLPHQVAIA